MALEDDDADQFRSELQCIGLYELFGHPFVRSYVFNDRARTCLIPLHRNEEIPTSKADGKTFVEQSRRARTATKVLNERIAKATGSVGFIIRGLDLSGTILARVRRCRVEQLEAGSSGDTLYASNYTSNYRAAIHPTIYAPSQAHLCTHT
jgi:hypothetical protein